MRHFRCSETSGRKCNESGLCSVFYGICQMSDHYGVRAYLKKSIVYHCQQLFYDSELKRQSTPMGLGEHTSTTYTTYTTSTTIYSGKGFAGAASCTTDTGYDNYSPEPLLVPTNNAPLPATPSHATRTAHTMLPSPTHTLHVQHLLPTGHNHTPSAQLYTTVHNTHYARYARCFSYLVHS